MKRILYILCLLSLTACSIVKPLVRQQKPVKPVVQQPVQVSKALDYEERLRFNELYHAGLVARMGQNFDAAFELFNEAFRINPSSAETAYELALLYQDVEMSDLANLAPLADSFLLKSVVLAPGNKFYKISLIDRYSDQGRTQETIPLAREVAETYPTAENFLRLERLCETVEDYEGALYALNRLENIEGKNLETTVYKFNAYKKLGREAEAFRAMEDLCKAYPTELRYRVRMGDFYLLGGHEDMALATYRDVLTLDPDNDAAQRALLEYHLQKRDTQSFNALVHTYLMNPRGSNMEKSVLLADYLVENSDAPDSVAGMLRSILFMEKPKRNLVDVCADYLAAMENPPASYKPFYDRVLEIDPSYNQVRLQALKLVALYGTEEDFLRHCREARIYEPGNAIYYYYEGLTLYRQDKIQAAIDVLDDGTAYADESTPKELVARLHSMRAEFLLDLNDVEEACKAYDSALVYDPGNPETLSNYATLLTETGESLEKALEMGRQAVDAAPHDPIYLGTYAYALACLERYEEARTVADSAMVYAAQMPDWNDNPEYGRLIDHTGDIYYHLGHTGEAVKLWQQAVAHTEEPEIRAAIQHKIRRRRI